MLQWGVAYQIAGTDKEQEETLKVSADSHASSHYYMHIQTAM